MEDENAISLDDALEIAEAGNYASEPMSYGATTIQVMFPAVTLDQLAFLKLLAAYIKTKQG